MLIENTKGHKGDDLREKLDRSFSTEYINDSLWSINILIFFFNIYSYIKWILFSLPLAYVISAVEVAVKNRTLIQKTGMRKLDFFSSGIYFALIFFILMGIAYFWRYWWLRRIGGKSLTDWASKMNLLGFNYNFMAIASFIIGFAIYYIFPVYVDSLGRIFGIFNINNVCGMNLICFFRYYF